MKDFVPKMNGILGVFLLFIIFTRFLLSTEVSKWYILMAGLTLGYYLRYLDSVIASRDKKEGVGA